MIYPVYGAFREILNSSTSQPRPYSPQGSNAAFWSPHFFIDSMAQVPALLKPGELVSLEPENICQIICNLRYLGAVQFSNTDFLEYCCIRHFMLCI